MAKSKQPRGPRFEAPQDPGQFDHLRNSLPGRRIAGIRPDVIGGYRHQNDEREDTVALGHPEAAGQYTTRYNHRDKYLGDLDDDAPTERLDLNYAGPEEIRERSKGSY